MRACHLLSALLVIGPSLWISGSSRSRPLVAAERLMVARAEDAGMSSEGLQKLAEYIQGKVEGKEVIGVALAVGRQGKMVHLRGYGVRDTTTQKPLNTDTIVRLYSMSKPLTTVAAMTMWEEGRFKLDDPVSEVLPQLQDRRVARRGEDGEVEFVAAEREITFRHLMQHTAGFGYGLTGMPGNSRVEKVYKKANLFDPDSTLEEFLAKVEKLPLASQPGTAFRYSLSVDLLGHVLEKLDGKPLDELMRERVFEPLGMRDTGFHVPAESADRFASVHTTLPGVGAVVIRPAAGSPFLRRPKLLLGGNGIVSTAEDYARFCRMLMSGGRAEDGSRFLQPETVAMMTTGQLPEEVRKTGRRQRRRGRDFGFGFAIRSETDKEGDANTNMGEFGWGGAANTFFWCDPKTEIFVVIMRQSMPMSLTMEYELKPILKSAIRSDLPVSN
jgi:CubicO group peptidase (beta-lactamase class C family)